MIAVLAAGLIVAGDTVIAQQGGVEASSSSEATVATALAESSNENVAAVPAALPLPKQHFVGSLLYKRTVGMERFDTDHDIDGADGVDREIFGSHYVMGNEFKVRIPASYSKKPDGVLGFPFNHIVFEVSSLRFTADCVNPRTYLYRGTSSWRWICSLNFGSRANSWNSAIRAASDVKIVAFWSDKECKEEGAYGIKDKEDLLETDCKTLLAIKHYWLDEVADNRKDLPSHHALFSWGVGDIEKWGGVEVGFHYSNKKEFRDRCNPKKENCPRRVEYVSLPRVGDDETGIVGGVPVEFGGQSGSCDVSKRVLCGLGALQYLNLSGNSLSGGIPRELGNAGVAPCEPDERSVDLDVDALASLGLAALVLIGAFVPGAGPFIVAGATAGGLGLQLYNLFGGGVEVTLDTYFTGCPKDREDIDTTTSAFRKYQSSNSKVREFDIDIDIDGLLFAVELSSVVASNEDFVIRGFGREWRFGYQAAKSAGDVAGAIGAALDIADVFSGLYDLDRLEFFHQDRSQLVHLDLSENQLSGVVPFEIGNLERLRMLLLNGNGLSGLLPADAGRSGRAGHDNLAVLDLKGNSFSGEVPDLLSSNLRHLDLSYNRLSGGLPEGLSLSPELKHIDLSRNADPLAIGSGISGVLTDEIISLSKLEHLGLSSNKLTGDLSSNIGKKSPFYCEIPVVRAIARFFSACKERVQMRAIEHFDVSNNMFYGEVPNNFKNLDNLETLYLNDNCFHGMQPELPGSIKNSKFSGNFFNSQIGSSTNLLVSGSASCGKCLNGTHLPVDASNKLKIDCIYLIMLRDSLRSSASVISSTRADRVLNSWSRGKMDSWEGVELKHAKLSKSDNRVKGLNLSDMNINGDIPSQVFRLSGLESLDMSSNQISGELPEELLDFDNLEFLDLSSNRFSGEIPVGLAYLRRLTDLNLSHNMLSGEIPVGVGQGFLSIVNLNLSHNQITGSLPKLCLLLSSRVACAEFHKLESLDLSHNLLTGEIPRDYYHLAPRSPSSRLRGRLGKMWLNSNCLEIDDKTVSSLKGLGINDLLVEGNPVGAQCPGLGGCADGFLVLEPDENVGLVADCEVLLELLEFWSGDALDDWGTKKISEWSGVVVPNERVPDRRVTGLSLPNQGISGVVPAVIGDLGGLVSLDLSSNRLWGTLPGELGDLSVLEVLDLSGNNLWGGLPSEVGNLSVLEVLDLSGNRLRGALPSVIGNLSVLTDLDLSGNNLSGGLPARLGRLGKLDFLDLSGNRFSGRIPSGLGRLSSLTYLDLSDNRLSGAIPAVSGRIPAGLGRLVKLEVLDLSSNELSGAIPAGLGGFLRLERLVLADNKLSGGIPAQLGNLNALAARGLDLRGNCLLRPVPSRVSDLGDSVVLVGRNLFLAPDDNPWCVPCSDGTFLPRSSTRNLMLDCFWLVEARRALHGGSGVPEFSKAAGWGTVQNLDMRRWRGVGKRDGRVRSLDLSVPLSYGFIASTGAASSLYRSQKLTGSIPVELASLWALESLNLSNNRFEGAIPIELGSLSRLVSLDLSLNRLSGEVPEDLGDLLELATLDLSHNRLEGPVPEALGQPVDGSKQLAALFLNDNFLTGSIPDVLGNLPLVSLHLHYNCIVGATPANLKVKDFKREPNRGNCADRCSNGKYVASPGENKSLVNDCRVLLAARDSWAEWGSLSSQAHISNWGSGESAKIGDWGGVEVADSGGEMRVVGLALPGNGLSEGIPETLEDLGGLVSLDLSHNKITDPNGGLGKLAVSADLVELDLSANGIKGQIPTSIGGLSKLRRLVLSDNELSGIIPSGPTPVPGATPLLDRLPALEHLDLSGNALKGLVPSSLSVLKHLDLSDNEITGRLPGGLFEAEELSHLDLSSNQLAGALPEKLYKHSSLEYLDLSGNRFSGAVKSDFKSKTLVRLDLSDNQFSGSLPSLPLAGLGLLKIPKMPPNASENSADVYIVLEETSSQDVIISVAYHDSGDYRNTVSLAQIKEAGLQALEIPKLPNDPPNAPSKYLILGDAPLTNTARKDRNPDKYFVSLTYIDLSRNQFTGPIPIGYQDLADGRPMERLDLSRNQITGDLPEWIKLLQFSDSDDYERSPDSLTNPEPDTFLVSLEHNQMCTPQDYALGDFRRNNGKTAPVDIKLGNNECPEDDHASIYVPGSVLVPTYERPEDSLKDLQVLWQHSEGQTGLTYIVEPVLKDAAPESQPEGEDCQVVTSNATATITSSESCDGFDAQYYTAKITPVFAPAGSENRYYGDTARAEEKKVYLKGWQFRTVQQRTTMQAIHDSLGLENDEEIYWWDGANQVWLSYSKTGTSRRNRTLQAGTTIAIQNFPANADLDSAKLGSADSDTSVLLHNGWNVVPAGGNTTRPAGNNGAWFIDSSFISCGYGWFFFSLAGVRAILRYDIENESYDIELPCDQAEETRVISTTQDSRVVCLNAPCSIAVGTRYTARSGIDEISEYDPLYILFYSYLPVSARWENGKYVPG